MSANSLKKIFFTFFLLIAFFPFQTNARNFLRTVKVGDYGEDVRFIQQILNLDPLTQIVNVGLGSPGHETTYFGIATKNAIIRFQNLYANDVLKPSGLSSGTGFAGWRTLKKINELSDAYNKAHPVLVPIETPKESDIVGTSPFVSSVTPAIFGSGDNIKIKGQNFDMTNNTVLFSIESDTRFTGIHSFDTKNIDMSVQLVLADAMAKGMSSLKGDTRARAIAYLIQKGKFVAGPGDGSAYTPVTISVKNKNGESNSFSVLVRVINK